MCVRAREKVNEEFSARLMAKHVHQRSIAQRWRNAHESAISKSTQVPRYPAIREERCEVTERYSILEPYSLLQIGALLRRQGHEVALIDMNGFDLKMEDLSI